MKVSFRSWRLSLPMAAAVACSGAGTLSTNAWAQQPIAGVELAEPIDPAPKPLETGAVEGAQPAVPQNAVPQNALPQAAEPTPAGTPSGDLAPAPAPVDLGAKPVAKQPGAKQAGVELVQERFPSGKIKIEREMILDAQGNYVLHGSWKQYDEQGAVVSEGQYVHNRKEGEWRRTYRGGDAPLLATAPYKDFTAPFSSQATFKHGRLDGKWTIVDSLQRKVHEIDFQAGDRHGIAAFYFPSGSVMLQSPFEHGLVNGDVLDYATDGTITGKEHFEAGRKLSQKTEYHDAKNQVKKSETMYLHATLAAKTQDNWDAGQLAAFEVRGQDEKHGPFTTWHPNGQIARQGEFRYNLPVGSFVFWFANGQKQMEGSYIDGQPQGPWTWWHENGQKSIGGDYKDGQPIGSWSWWKSSGKLTQKTDFTAGKPPVVAPLTETERTARPPANALPGTTLQR